jgi:hypothetical protein
MIVFKARDYRLGSIAECSRVDVMKVVQWRWP